MVNSVLMAHGHLKAADLGGDGSDIPFEQAFSNLAHAYLKDRAPGLLDFEIGFQLVDRNDDNTKAIGIMGFKVGSNWLYAPTFFINGNLKGNELLIIKNQDAFVPLKENWINYLLSKKPASLGEGVGRNTRELGVHYPDMFRALQSPHKYASIKYDAAWVKAAMAGEFTRDLVVGTKVKWAKGEASALAKEAAAVRARTAETDGALPMMKDWAAVATATMAKAATKREAFRPVLLDVVRGGGVKMAAALHATLSTYPMLRVAFDAMYDAAAVKEAFEHVRANPEPLRKEAHYRPVVRGSVLDAIDRAARDKVEVHWFRGFDKLGSVLLDDADREALVRDGMLIKDAREDGEVSKAYAVDVRIEFEKKLTNPPESGVYDVLAKDGSLEKCLVLLGPMAPARRTPYATIIRLESSNGKKAWLNIHPSYVYVAKQYKGWADWWEGLPDASTLSRGSGCCVVVGPDGLGTLPFYVKKDLGKDAGGGDGYEVCFDDSCSKERPALSTGSHMSPKTEYNDYDQYSSWRDGQRIHLGQKTGTKLCASGGDVYVPEGYKLLKLQDDAGEGDAEEANYSCSFYAGRSDTPPILVGNALDVELNLVRKMASIKLYHDGSETVINGRRLPAKKAYVHLVTGHGFRAEAARELLKQAATAQARGHGSVSFYVKYAAPYAPGGQPGGRGEPYLTSGGPYAPEMIDPMQGYDDVMGSNVAAQHPLEESVRVTDLKADPRNRDAYDPANPDPMASQVAQDAGDKGQKEVFDTAMVANLLKITREDEMVDKHIGDLMKGLDRCGRLLFQFFWHGEEFAERYGDQDMPELEDSLRNTFESLGDLVLFLKQKTVEANPDEAAQDISLGAVASQ